MRMYIESTEVLVNVDGVECRLWEGTTENGVDCKVLIHRIAVSEKEDQSEFEKLLPKVQPNAVVAGTRRN